MSETDARKAARAIDALRRGWPFRVNGADGVLDLLAVESARDAALADFAGKDVLRAAINLQLNHTDLTGLLFLQGYRKADFITGEAG